ncbi:MAG: helix-turn-helix transcriptional regulator [Hyphomicrobiaceae bacterium]|nr:helix-turn-helix transcriptional regulator [Hyphomicrobiaceae bacterium]
MDSDDAIRALGALAQEHRLAVFRRLVAVGAAGQTAGQLAELVGIAPQALSFHVKELERAGLVSADREGRFIRYRLAVGQMRELMTFLSEDCCGGRPELCGGFSTTHQICCEPTTERARHVKPK